MDNEFTKINTIFDNFSSILKQKGLSKEQEILAIELAFLTLKNLEQICGETTE